ncbi:hypothetical protein, partial [Lachnotalea glycerini]|uniref:hypothetical protein n=1 Tax=Lachnotalea glycerini TaxID=1763509 RepID=UPI001FA8B12A
RRCCNFVYLAFHHMTGYELDYLQMKVVDHFHQTIFVVVYIRVVHCAFSNRNQDFYFHSNMLFCVV